MSEIRKNLGGVTAYAYARSKGYTGTEEEFAQLMANYATVGETATEAAEQAISSAEASGVNSLKSEGCSVGKQNGEDVEEGSPYYHNNAKYYAEEAKDSETNAATSASAASTSATAAAASATAAANNAAAAQAAADEAEEVLESIPEDYSDLSDDMIEINKRIDTISYPVNYADISEETFSYSSLPSLSKTYNNDGTVSFSFEETANPIVVYRALSGLEVGKSYISTIEVLTGALASTVSQKVGVVAPDGTIFAEVSSDLDKRKENENVIIPFTATEESLGIQIGLIYSSKNVTVKVTTIPAEGQEYYIKNTALKDIPFEALDADLQSRISESADQCRMLYSDSNLLDGVSTTSGKYINGNTGVPTATGAAMSATDFIPVDGGKVYYYYNVYHGYWAFYSDASESSYISGSQYISGDGVGGGYFTVPANATHARFTLKNSVMSTAWISVRNAAPSGSNVYALKKNYLSYRDYPTNPCDYNGTEISVFHKCACIGDSLTAGVCNYTEGGQPVINVTFPNYAYPTQLAKITGVETANKGIAGRTTAQWYAEMSEADLSGFDMAIIQLGVNDALYNDGWTTEESTALGNIITKLKNENNNIKIFIATIIPAISYQGTAFNSVSEGIRNFVAGLNDSNVMLVDLALYGHTGEDVAYNNGHLTALGYFKLSEDYKAYISWLIKTNPEDFRTVQFIGTTHEI